ncbi:hypothetical protein J7K86_01160 [bacterium]|nr:hypothetical protein [bacterium]
MSKKLEGRISPQETPEKKPKTKSTIELGESRVRLVKKKSEYPGYTRVEIIFDDIYQGELADKYGWNENQIDSFDTQLFAKLQDKEAIINWEDREFFTVDVPENATEDVIADIELALKLTFSNPLSKKEDIEKAEKLRQKIKNKQEELARQELAKVRTEENLFQAYKEKPHATSPADHEGYCTISKVKIKKASGITYTDDEFLGREHRRIATKPNMVILSVSIAGEPFDRLYGGRVIQKEQFGNYESELEKIIKGLQSQPDEIVKISHKVSITRSKGQEADGEEIKLLCTEDFANKVTEHIKSIYSDLRDISKEG